MRGWQVCGLCIMFRGTGRGSGGNPVKSDWQLGFVCDQCPECGFGALDKQVNGDGRWSGEWYPVQCPVGSSTFSYGYQGGNPWYRKLQVANARVPVAKVELFDGYTKGFKVLTATIDNYHEVNGALLGLWWGWRGWGCGVSWWGLGSGAWPWVVIAGLQC